MAGRKNLFEPVAENLISLIHQRRLLPGALLPSEHALCNHYSLSRTAIRKALDVLESRGFIRRQPGVGSFVCDTSPKAEDEILNIGITMMPSFSYAFPAISGAQIECANTRARLLSTDNGSLREDAPYDFQSLLYVEVSPFVEYSRLNQISERGIPIALLNRMPEFPNLAYFAVDFRKEAARAGKMLFELGCRKIGAIQGRRFGAYGNDQRILGYRDAMANCNLTALECIPAFDSLRATDEIAEFLREHRPDALFLPLVGVLDWTLFACRQLGLEVGKDIQIFCFDRLDSEVYANSNVIYANMPLELMGKDMITYLAEKVRRPGTPVIRRMYETTFVFPSRIFSNTAYLKGALK